MTIQFSVFQRKRRKDGRKRKDKRYTIQLRFADGRVQQRVAFTDKGASKQLAAKMVRDLERREVGLHDKFGQSRRTPLDQHLDAFVLAMKNGSLARRRHGKPTEDYVKRTKKRLAWMLDSLAATRLEHLKQEDAERFFADRVAAGWSDKTRDDHAAVLRQFGSWLVDAERWSTNPFHRLRPTRNEASKTFRRHALTVAELEQLVEAAVVRGVQQYARVNEWAKAETMAELGIKGEDRAVLYQVAAYTGLRRKELCSLVWEDVQLGAEPAIDVRAETQKTKKRARLELPAWLGKLLQQVRDRSAATKGGPLGATERVFGTLSYRHITEQLKLDAVFARLGRLDPESGRVLTPGGKVVDLHALRGTLATLAAEVGMPVKLLQQHMRHSDVRITMEVYTQVRNAAMREQIELLPAPKSASASAGSARTLANDCEPNAGTKSRKETGT